MGKKRILMVTGASSCIGTAFIEKVWCKYDTIWAHYNESQDKVCELRETIGDSIMPIQADFLNISSTERFINTIIVSGKIPDHIVHLSAPKAQNLQFHKNSWTSFQQEIDISVRSITMVLQRFIPYMMKKQYGKIVFMLSSNTLGIPPKYQSSYILVKYALLGLMKSISSEYGSRGIWSNAVSPDMIDTSFLSNIPELIKEQKAKNSSLGRILCVDEVVPTLEYLVSKSSDMVTGQNIAITG